MRNLIIERNLETPFWSDYSVLWQNSPDKSPFQSPALLHFFAQQFRGKSVAVNLEKNNKLFGSVILKIENDIYSFLSDLKTDANFFVFHRECLADDIAFFFSGLFDVIKKEGWVVMLNNVPAWASYTPLLEQQGAKSNLFFQSMSYSVSPAFISNDPQEIRRKLNRPQNARAKANKLRERFNAEFEVLTGDEDLEKWVEEFCNTHIKRWEKTSTPSQLSNKNRQLFLLECLKAWNTDKVLVRFSIKVNEQRIGFMIGLQSGNSLISHSLTYHPDYYKFSPVFALFPTIAEWIIGKGLNSLDFGDGNEQYKYYFSNQELVLKRVFISGKTNYSFVAKAKFIKFIRNNSSAYSFYQRKIKKYLKRNRDAKIKAGNP